MKIKQLEWEDCNPTISSSVISRAQALGYTFEIVENLDEDGGFVLGYCLYVNGSLESIEYLHSEEAAQRVAPEWLKKRIGEMVEMKAAEIKWTGDNHEKGDAITYFIYPAGSGRHGLVCKWGDEEIGFVDVPFGADWTGWKYASNAARRICQEHKQGRLNSGTL